MVLNKGHCFDQGSARELTCANRVTIKNQSGPHQEKCETSSITTAMPVNTIGIVAFFWLPATLLVNGATSSDEKLVTIRIEEDVYGLTVQCKADEAFSQSSLSLELTHLPTNGHEHSVATVQKFSNNDYSVLGEDYQSRHGITFGGITYLDVKLWEVTCFDAGVYKCRLIYRTPGQLRPKVAIASRVFQPCNPGALITVSGTGDHSLGCEAVDCSFTCRADPAVASLLLSPEISLPLSRDRFQRRKVLAYINRYTNGGRPHKQAATLTPYEVDGVIHPLNASSSWLSISTRDPTQRNITRCTATFLKHSSDKDFVQVFSDRHFVFN